MLYEQDLSRAIEARVATESGSSWTAISNDGGDKSSDKGGLERLTKI